MRKLFTTADVPTRDTFGAWMEVTQKNFVPAVQENLAGQPFEASISGDPIGNSRVTIASYDAHTVDFTPSTIRKHDKTDRLLIMSSVSGIAQWTQHGRKESFQPGKFGLIDMNAPTEIVFPVTSSTFLIEIPREPAERMLGPARLFTTLKLGDLPGASLARTFLEDLTRLHEQLSPEMAERMAGVGIDLLIASIAERMAQDTPKSLQGNVIVQRAKAYIMGHLHEAALDPPLVAAAVGVSLRRLQQLFHDHGRHVSDWIWEKRLEMSARRLTDPSFQHLSVGAVSYGCGFVSQAHFSRRFKDRYDLSPRDYRAAAARNRENGASQSSLRAG